MAKMRSSFIQRHMEAVTPTQLKTPITVIGAGAIGSFVVLSLAKLGFNNITVWDFDEVSEENIGNQFYRVSDIGKPKVVALSEMINDFTGVSIVAYNEKLTSEHTLIDTIVISAVDSMEVRKLIYQNCSPNTILLDPRMAAETARFETCYMQDAEDRKSYERTLYSDAKAVAERCTYKTTMYTVLLMAGTLSKMVLDYTKVTHHPRRILSADWDIKNNQFTGFTREGGPL